VASNKPRVCKDCGSTTRELKHPGPRCTTCHRAVTKQRKQSTHDAYVCRTYGLRPGEYAKLYEMQDGRCCICQKALGKSRRLAVEHNHDCCPETPACGNCVRGLCCAFCNYEVLGRLNPEALARAYWYLMDPPGPKMLAEIRGEASCSAEG
jgi:hypothetical protein